MIQLRKGPSIRALQRAREDKALGKLMSYRPTGRGPEQQQFRWHRRSRSYMAKVVLFSTTNVHPDDRAALWGGRDYVVVLDL